MFSLKNRRFRPSKVSQSRRKFKVPEAIRKLSRSVTQIQLEEVSSCSDISDVFEEQHRNSFLAKSDQNGKRLSKMEADKTTMASFTENFLKTMAKTRKELGVGESMMAESVEDILCILNNPKPTERLSEEFEKIIQEKLRDREHINSTPSQSEDFPAQESKLSFNPMSGIWRLLKAENKTDFRITPPNYNILLQNIPHWLDSEPLPWDIVNQAKLKCEKWLKEQCE